MNWTTRTFAFVALIGAAVGVAACRDFTAGSTSASEGDSAVSVTIAQLRSSPGDFARKRVKLTGQLSECYGWECSLCPDTMTNDVRNEDRCLPLSFRPLIEGTGFGAAEQENVFRFSKVVLVATFDPSCWEEGGCLDRQTVLREAEVITVRERRAGSAGLWLQGRSTLTEISGDEAIKLRSAAQLAGYPDGPPIKAFESGGSDRRTVVCWSPVGSNDEPGAWPTSLEGALYAKSTLDFFHCNEVKKVGEQLVLQV